MMDCFCVKYIFISIIFLYPVQYFVHFNQSPKNGFT